MNRKNLGFLLVFVCSVLASPAQDLLFTNNLVTTGLTNSRAIAHDGADSWVVVGEGTNVVKVTFNGLGYTVAARPLPANATLNAIIYVGNNTYVAGGRPFGANASLILVSTNGGDNWFTASAPFSSVPVQGLAFDAGLNRLVAVGALVNIAYSDWPGIAWNLVPPGNFEGSPIFDSFSDVEALGGGNFVASGNGRSIRFSDNNAVNWDIGLPLTSLADPDMNAVSSVYGRVVAVGQGGAIFVSFNDGIDWTTNVTSGTTGNLNAIFPLGNNLPADGNLLVAGDAGAILSSADGLTWINRGSQSGSALRGGFFATDVGILAGTGVLVGDNGVAVISGTAPAAASSAGNLSACPDDLPVPLSATVVADVNHPVGTVTVDWFANATGGTVLPNGAGTLNFAPTNTLPPGSGLAQTFTFFAQTRDLRTGFTSTTRTPVSLTINPEPATTNVAVTICSRATVGVALQAAVTNGVIANFSWAAAANGNVTGESTTAVAGGIITDALTNQTATAQTVVYTVTPTSTNGCVGDVFTVSVTVDPEPVAVGLAATICSRGTVGLALQSAITNGVVASFSWVATANAFVTGESTTPVVGGIITDSLTNVTGAAQIVFYSVTPASTNGCVGSPFTVAVTVNPEPVATNLVATVCSGLPVNLPLQSAVANNVISTFSWVAAANPNVSGESTTLVVGGFITNVLSNVTATPQVVIYTVTPTSSNGCVGNPFTVSVTVNPEPVATNLTVTSCSGVSAGVGLQSAVTNNVTSTFSWVAAANPNVAGESTTPVVGGVITNVLSNVTATPQVVVYTVTPTSTNGCIGSPFSVSVTVNPQPAATNLAATNCSGSELNIALSAAVTNGVTSTFSWVAAANPNVTGESITPVGNGAITNTLVNTATNTQVVVYTVTPISTNGCTGNPFTVTVTVDLCNSPLTIQQLDATNVVVEWVGNLTLLSTTNLTEPGSWITNIVGGAGTNRFTNSIVVPPPYRFFRLTNAP